MKYTYLFLMVLTWVLLVIGEVSGTAWPHYGFVTGIVILPALGFIFVSFSSGMNKVILRFMLLANLAALGAIIAIISVFPLT